MLILRHTSTYIQIANRLNQSDGSIANGVVNKGNSKVLSSIPGSHKVAGKGRRVSLTSTYVQSYECLCCINSNNEVDSLSHSWGHEGFDHITRLYTRQLLV